MTHNLETPAEPAGALDTSIEELLSQQRTLNIDSGRKKVDFAINVDLVSETDPDLVLI